MISFAGGNPSLNALNQSKRKDIFQSRHPTCCISRQDVLILSLLLGVNWMGWITCR
jgi:hypothetical protein